VGPGPPVSFCAAVISMSYLRNCPTGYQGWTKICSPSALAELLHRLLRHALAVSRLGVAFHFGYRRVAGDGCNLVCAASDLGETASSRLASAVRRDVEASRRIAQVSEPISKPWRGVGFAEMGHQERPAENRTILRWMWDLFRLIFGLVIDLFRSRAALEAEVLVLKQQIIVLRRGKPSRIPFLAVDRVVLGWTCHLFPKARGALAIVRPDSLSGRM
jgi:hypothetical protein